MAVYLLDTSVLVDFLRAHNDRPALLRRLVEDGHHLAACPVTVAEVFAGMREEEDQPTTAFLAGLRYYDLPPAAARTAGRFRYEWARKGQTLSLADTLIATAAVHHGLVLLTDNAKHYPMPELTLETP